MGGGTSAILGKRDTYLESEELDNQRMTPVARKPSSHSPVKTIWR